MLVRGDITFALAEGPEEVGFGEGTLHHVARSSQLAGGSEEVDVGVAS